ncbi:MAG: hypothetical protein ACM3X4_12970 [Ignavibacteriales bacterium]
MSMPVGESPKRIRWKAGKEDELWAFMQERLSSGANISEALKTYADRNGISWLTARWKYYRLKQDRSQVAPPQIAGSDGLAPGPAQAGDRTIETLSDFFRSASSLGDVDLTGLLEGLASMARLAVEGRRMKQAEQRLHRWETLIAEARREHESLSELIREWTAAPGVERIASIGDFEARLKAAVEALGGALTACGEDAAGMTAAR